MTKAPRLTVLTLRAPTESEGREAQRELYDLVHCLFALSGNGHWLERTLYKRGRVALKRGAFYVVHARTRFRPIEAAHVLRVGPDGPLFDPIPFGRPLDGDHAHVHPDNWVPIPREEIGAAGRAAAARARAAAVSARLLMPWARPGTPWYGPAGHQITDPRYWWAKAAATWGETDPTLSCTWAAAPDCAPQQWALCHYLAQRAQDGTREVLASTAAHTDGRTSALLELREVLYAERLAIATGPAERRAQITATMRAARARGELPDSPMHAAAMFQARTEPVPGVEPTAAPSPTTEPAGNTELY